MSATQALTLSDASTRHPKAMLLDILWEQLHSPPSVAAMLSAELRKDRQLRLPSALTPLKAERMAEQYCHVTEIPTP